MSKIDPKFKTKWAEISAKNFAGQAQFFLNGFWEDLSGESENIYKLWQKFIVQDADKKKKEMI